MLSAASELPGHGHPACGVVCRSGLQGSHRAPCDAQFGTRIQGKHQILSAAAKTRHSRWDSRDLLRSSSQTPQALPCGQTRPRHAQSELSSLARTPLVPPIFSKRKCVQNRISTEGSRHVHKSNFAHDLLPTSSNSLRARHPLKPTLLRLPPRWRPWTSPWTPARDPLARTPATPNIPALLCPQVSCGPLGLWKPPQDFPRPFPLGPPPAPLIPPAVPSRKKTEATPRSRGAHPPKPILPNPSSQTSVPSESPEPRATPRTACQHPFPPRPPPPGPLPPSSLSRPLPLSVRGGGAPSPGQREHVSRAHGTPMRKSNAQNHCKNQKNMEPCFTVFSSRLFGLQHFYEDGNISNAPSANTVQHRFEPCRCQNSNCKVAIVRNSVVFETYKRIPHPNWWSTEDACNLFAPNPLHNCLCSTPGTNGSSSARWPDKETSPKPVRAM